MLKRVQRLSDYQRTKRKKSSKIKDTLPYLTYFWKPLKPHISLNAHSKNGSVMRS